MKMSKIFSLVFIISFMVGVGLMAMTPVPVQAGPSPCEGANCGFTITCQSSPSCTGYENVMLVKCYRRYFPLAFPCQGPFDCGCTDLGCTAPCDIE